MLGELRGYANALIGITGWKLALAVAIMVVASLTEGVGVALLLPTLQMAGVDLGAGSGAGRYAAKIDSAITAIGLRPTLILMLGLFVAIVCVRAMLARAQSIAAQSVQERFCQRIRQRLYEAISGANWLFICKSRSSDFVHALTGEVDRVGAATYYVLMLVSGAVVAGLYAAASFALFPAATLVALGLCAALGLALRGKTRAIHRGGEEYSDLSAQLYAAAIEYLQSLKTARMYGAQQRNCRIFGRLNQDAADTSLAIAREHLSAESWFEIGSALMLGAVLMVAIKLLAVSAAGILILLILFSRVVPRVRSIQSHYRGFAGMIPAFATVAKLEQRCRAAAEPAATTEAALELRSAVRFEKVSFSYEAGQAPVLRDLDLVIPAGRTTAIVGPSGAGKSTIADLLMGLIPPGSGRVTVDGAPLGAGAAPAWRERIGYVAQDTFLFHDTVRANLLWARPEAAEREMLDALRMAAAEDFVAGLPNGLDTVIGDRGATISQGERQRIALARALLRRPSLLVLDEATNSLDSDNEARILSAIERIQGRVTVVLIAHRLSTIRWADLIYVIEGGRLVESGDWTTLAAKLDGGSFHADGGIPCRRRHSMPAV